MSTQQITRRLSLLLALALASACGSVSSKDPDANTNPQPDANIGGPDADTTSPDADTTSPDASVDASTAECTPDVTTCEEDTLTVCDSTGHVDSQTTCALGCFDTSRCNKLDPSNDLATHLDAAASTLDVTFAGTATIDTDVGSISDQNGALALSTATVSDGPVPIFVIRVKSLTASDVNVTGASALAIVSDGNIVINGTLDVSGENETNGAGANTADSTCHGKNGNSGEGWSGGGGAGFGGLGGSGGKAGSVQGGLGGGTSGNASLTPLRGGCPGGHSGGGSQDSDPIQPDPGGGGGAVQLVSNTSIEVNGAIAANGGGAKSWQGGTVLCLIGTRCYPGDGGGSGGGILLEAPVVTVASTGGLYANGGGGASCRQFSGSDGLLSDQPAPGGDCGNGFTGGDGGAGASVDGTDGADGDTDSSTPGGGGGVGRIRVNMKLGASFSPEGTVSPTATAGAVGTR